MTSHSGNGKRIRSTNGVERLHAEVKSRIRAVGAFPDRASALRLITAVLIQATAICTESSYIDVWLLAPEEEASIMEPALRHRRRASKNDPTKGSPARRPNEETTAPIGLSPIESRNKEVTAS